MKLAVRACARAKLVAETHPDPPEGAAAARKQAFVRQRDVSHDANQVWVVSTATTREDPFYRRARATGSAGRVVPRLVTARNGRNGSLPWAGRFPACNGVLRWVHSSRRRVRVAHLQRVAAGGAGAWHTCSVRPPTHPSLRGSDLQMTRSLGDWRASDMVLPLPQIHTFEVRRLQAFNSSSSHLAQNPRLPLTLTHASPVRVWGAAGWCCMGMARKRKGRAGNEALSYPSALPSRHCLESRLVTERNGA